MEMSGMVQQPNGLEITKEAANCGGFWLPGTLPSAIVQAVSEFICGMSAAYSLNQPK